MSRNLMNVVSFGFGAVLVWCIAAGSHDDESEFREQPPVPLGLNEQLPWPADNRPTHEQIVLGERLFFDTILSADGSTSCATCHVPDRAFAGDSAVPVGVYGRIGRRNAPSLMNRAFGPVQFWDGRATTLEEQALMPIENKDELGSTLDDVLARLSANESYSKAFEAAFDDGLNAANLGRAIASYERTLLSGNSANDRFNAGDAAAMSEAARKGKWLFESRGQCWRCHAGHNFTDEEFHNTGVNWGGGDLGRFEVTGLEEDLGRFKTPSLRDVALTAPYMHDGSIATLREAIEFYRLEGELNPHLDPIMKPLNLTDEDVAHLVAFLESLTGEVEPNDD